MSDEQRGGDAPGGSGWGQSPPEQQGGWDQQSGWDQQARAPGWQQTPSGSSATNGLAIASLPVGIIALLTGFLFIGGLFGLIAIGLGIGGLSAAKRTGTGKGMAIGGIVTGAFGILIAIGILIFGLTIAGRVADGSLALGVECASDQRAAAGTITLEGLEVIHIIVCSDVADDFAFEATVTNTGSEDIDATIGFEVLDASGASLGSGETDVALDAGESTTETAVSFDDFDAGWSEARVTQQP